MTKRGNGEGSIFQRKADKKWVGSLSLENGKRKVFYGKTKKEVTEKLIKARTELQKGMFRTDARVKLSDYIDTWLESYRRSVRPNTHQRACEIMRLHVLPTLGDIQLVDLLPTPEDGGFSQSLARVPASLRLARFGFHRTRSDSLSTGQDGQPSRHNVFRCIAISVVVNPTHRARPRADIKGKGFEKMPTHRTLLTGRVPPVNLDQGSTIPVGFVFQQGHKLSPAHIRDGFAQGGMLNHVLDRKTFYADRLVFTDQACRKLVQEVRTSVSDPGMETGHLAPRLVAILRAFFLFRVSALRFGQFLFIFLKETRVANHLSIGEGHKRFQAQVNADHARCGRQVDDVLFHQQTHAHSGRRRLWSRSHWREQHAQARDETRQCSTARSFLPG